MSHTPEPAAALPLYEITSHARLTSTLREVWGYGELLSFLVWRDVKVRYKQAVLGVAWAVLQPVALMGVFTVFLGRLAHVPSNGMPYPLFALSGLVIWQLFTHAVLDSSMSLIANERLITKIYFPRIIIPASAVLAAIVDFAVGFVVVIAMLPLYGVRVGATVLFAPLFVLLALFAAFGLGLWVSSINVRYRDARHILPLLVQIWMFATPIVYPSVLIPARWRLLYGVNPMVAAVEGFRWSVAGGIPPRPSTVVIAVAVTAALMVTGALYFQRIEDTFADVI